MGEFAPLVELLNDQKLEDLAADDMGRLSLREVVDLLRLVRKELEAADGLSPDEIPSSLRNEFLTGNYASSINSLLSGMDQYGETSSNPAQERAQFKQSAETLRNIVVERLRPIVRTDEAKVRKTLAEAAAMMIDLAQAREDLDKQRSALAQASATTASGDLAGFYKAQADGHAKSARTFFWAGGLAAVVLTVLTVWAFFIAPPEYKASQTTAQWIEFVRHSVARLALLSVTGFVVAFCVRNYRVNMHLEVLNKRRENALNTFGLMQAAVTSEDARNIVVGELVRSVFTSEETGYLGTDTERTVIEQPGGAGMLSAITAMARGGKDG